MTVIEYEVVDFRVFYVERNLMEIVEDSPVGSYDQFWHTLTWFGNVQIVEDTLTFDCTMHITKLWTKMDGTKEWYSWESALLHITVGSEGFLLDRPLIDPTLYQYFDVLGNTSYLKH